MKKMKTGCLMILVISSCVFGDALESIIGNSVPLLTNVTKQHDTILWYFNDTRIALINGDAHKSCLYYGEGGIFRDRLVVDYKSGSLNITNITAEHTGRYEAEIIRSKSTGTSQSLNRTSKCDGTKIIPKNNNLGDTIKTLFVSVRRPEKANESTEELQASDKNLRVDAGAKAGICLVFFAILGAVIYLYQKNIDKRGNGKRNEVI